MTMASTPEGHRQYEVAVVGLGYVGLPLALAFGRHMATLGFDIGDAKIAAYRRGHDPAGEVEPAEFATADRLDFTRDAAGLRGCRHIVVAVPTPVTEAKQPDLSPVIAACRSVGRNLSRGTVVIFESTVYPGVTDEVCGPILEQESGLKRGVDFFLGYSPERINPGDRTHRLESIVKVVAGEDAETLERVAALYGAVIAAGVYRAPTIKVAEAAKVIENTQRDLNIALMNELAVIFNRLGIDTRAVLEAAGTKWNFLPFRPGLVGGHCIGVDPYYLTHRAQMAGYHPEVILAGRRINDSLPGFVAQQTVKQMIEADLNVRGAKVLVLGLTFKENCRDLRNSKVADLVTELESFGTEVLVWDPIADAADARHEYDIELVDLEQVHDVSAVIVAVAHDEVRAMDLDRLASRTLGTGAPLMDVKWCFDRAAVTAAGFTPWQL